MSQIITLTVGALDENCYLVQPEDNQRLFIIDPGAEAAAIAAEVAKLTYTEAVILLTHAHFDHVGAVRDLMAELHINICFLSSNDFPLLKSPLNSYPPYYPQLTALPETTNQINFPEFKVLPLPGHTPGGVGFYFASLHALFSGDTIFASSVGRTDLPGSSFAALSDSIKQQIFTLPGNTVIYPGHGPETTVEREQRTNPYI